MNNKASFGGAFMVLCILSACGSVPATSVKDGAYTHRQSYAVEEYNFYIDVNASLKDGKIASIDVMPDPNGKTAQKYAEEFKKDAQSKIVGKTLVEAKQMGYVSGASETSKAFTAALDAIEKEASAK